MANCSLIGSSPLARSASLARSEPVAPVARPAPARRLPRPALGARSRRGRSRAPAPSRRRPAGQAAPALDPRRQRPTILRTVLPSVGSPMPALAMLRFHVVDEHLGQPRREGLRRRPAAAPAGGRPAPAGWTAREAAVDRVGNAGLADTSPAGAPRRRSPNRARRAGLALGLRSKAQRSFSFL